MIFIDMDGTIANFYENKNYIEAMHEQGFFYNLKPYKWVKELNKWAENREDVYILSACLDNDFCEKEKVRWLRKYLPNVKIDNYIFCKIGENKAKIVNEILQKDKEKMYGMHILVDDYSKNVYEWELQDFNYNAIKFVNGINNKHKRHYQLKAKGFKDFVKILKKLKY